MAKFKYKAKGKDGKIKEDKIEAPNKQKAEQILKAQGYQIISLSIDWGSIEIGGGGIPTKVVSIFTRQFSTMIGAGLPLMQCLRILHEQTENKAFKKVLSEMISDVESGLTLADAMKKHKKAFSDLYVNMVRAGEEGGALETILSRLATYLEKNEALTRKIKGAMIYPTIISIVMVIAVAVMLIFVIPIFAGMFTSFGGTLPLPTAILVNLSNFLRKNILFLIIAIVIIIVAVKSFQNTPQGRLFFDKLALAAPVFGDLQRKQVVARFSRTLATLLSSGVNIISALETTAKTAGNVVVEAAILKARTAIQEGESISLPLSKEKVFPPMVVQMIRIGEETGGLETMLIKVADFYDEEVDAAVEALMSALEPLIMVVLAVVVGGMMVAMYLPMFKMITLVSG
ncbi:MAG: type II secretion system F family protein [bacterium]|uniref:Type IV pilus assembly protein PilC n=2 Tax=Bacteria candidate phyla TaxID=1783234 RepID=A0A124G0M6_UNCT6|nr:MAG: Type IV pilus assembly protein PilC [candidate division TA06 bacterium 32_111]KUK87942.1 MAG: Type IV pilus assembly protein PilC [candidate division TA06 bacterium 34_109]MDI6700529.1 type II secretion system F family protein [bacterium]HAF08095.1 pilus assembly protein PilC [candidate division WOR-3 bacterium]HCP16204.1 pilus assembly protein PilC [candidate division WOR-3 bacterium]